MTEGPFLFDVVDLPTFKKEPSFKAIKHPLWTEHKARLIQEYIKLFTFITKHGTYIDGFAAPQKRDRLDLCSAALVLDSEPKWMKRFLLCDLDPAGVAILSGLKSAHEGKQRRIDVFQGDFNDQVGDVLAAAAIRAKTATFALLDQRTFECRWSTVEQIARHKVEGLKIELFYFFPSGWVDRSIAAISQKATKEKAQNWWGRPDWRDLRLMPSMARSQFVTRRFKEELGYRYAYSYPIHNKRLGGRTMYHMIHATDHDEAPLLMMRSYRKISGRSDIIQSAGQIDLDTLWSDSQEEVSAA